MADPTAPAPPVSSPRHMSMASQQAIDTLTIYTRELAQLEAEAARAEARLGSMLQAEALGAVKAAIAGANGRTERLQCVKIDGVMTGGLNSGKADAKSARKALTRIRR